MATAAQAANFIAKIGPLVQKYAKGSGYKIASTVIAQACCESAFGTCALSKYHNYFGMKCGRAWKGPSVNMTTKEEYKVGTLTTIKDNFRVYNSMEEGVAGYYGFIGWSRYANLKTATTPREYAERLKADGYATSSTYVNTLMKIVETYNLAKFDDFSAEAPVSSAPSVNTNKGPTFKVGNNYTLGVELNVRKGPGTNFAKKTHSQLTRDGQKHDKNKNGALDKGTQVTCQDIKVVGRAVWIKVPSGWICACDGDKVYLK